MSQQHLMIFAVAVVILVFFVYFAIWTSRFVRVAPNQVLIVSGRKVQRPDGSFAGFRIVKSGGTFVFPVIERADVLSLEVMAVEMPGAKGRTADGRGVQVDCVAQVKIKNDDPSLVAAAEHFLNKSPAAVATVVRPLLERHVSEVLANSSLETVSQNPAAWATLVQTAAARGLGKMGLSIIIFSVRNVQAV